MAKFYQSRYGNTRQKGAAYEDLAVKYLQRQGCEIIARNFYTRHGELDIVARHQGYLCFVEVKYRRDFQYGAALEAVSVSKLRRMYYAAKQFLFVHKLPDQQPIRFDVVAIQGEQIQWYPNAFEMV